jgi:hypothetical protein
MALEFADRFFVIVTQYGRIGTLVRLLLSNYSDYITVDRSIEINPQMHSVCDLTPDGRQVFSATTLLGRRDDDGIADLCARQLQERVAKSSRKPVLLAISLKQNSVEMLQTVLSILDTDAIKLW